MRAAGVVIASVVLAVGASRAAAVDAETWRKAHSPDWEQRYDAASALAKDGSREAIVLLARLLSDREASVRDEAAFRCGELKDAESVGVIAGVLTGGALTRPKPATRAAAAVALGLTRHHAAVAPLVEAGTSDADAWVRAEAIEALHVFPEDPRTAAACAQAVTDRSALVRAAAADAAWRLGAAGTPALLTAFADRDEGVRAAAFSSMPLSLARPRYAEAARDPSWRVRTACAESALWYGDAAGMDALVVLVADANDRVGSAAARALRKLSQKDYARDASLWQAWWAQNRAGWKRPPGNLEDPRTATGPGTKAQFMGLDVEGEATAFVLDFSGSMYEPTAPGGPRRLELLRTELQRSLAALPDGHPVNVHLFGKTVRSFANGVRPLTSRVREQIARFVAEKPLEGATDVLAGIQAALRDDAVDGVYVLSDGAPNGGVTDWQYWIARIVRREVRLRQAALHVVALGVTDASDRTFLEGLAATNQGRFVAR